jgi:hypothetical protein
MPLRCAQGDNGSGAPKRAFLFGSQHRENIRPEKVEELRIRPATLEASLRVLPVERAELGELAGAQLHVAQHSGGFGESIHGLFPMYLSGEGLVFRSHGKRADHRSGRLTGGCFDVCAATGAAGGPARGLTAA